MGDAGSASPTGSRGSLGVYLETERLVLRRFTEDDVDNLFELDSDPEVVRYANTGGRTAPYEEIRDEVLPRFMSFYGTPENLGYWAAVEKQSGEFIGWFHFRPLQENPKDVELGYRLKRPAWGEGYATEGSRALIKKGFTELGVERVVADALEVNTASIRVMEKSGLRFESRRAYTMYPDRETGRDMAMVRYALVREDFDPGSYPPP